jgi:hypothetical protein
MTTSFAEDGPFPPSALTENAAGRLTDDQRRRWSQMSRGFRKAELSFAVIVVIIGAVVAFAPGPAKDATIKPLIGLVCLVIAVMLVARALTGGDKITADVRSGRVESIDGAIAKHVVHSESGQSSSESHFLDVGGKRFETGPHGYDAAPDMGYVRLFFLPRSHRVVNLQLISGPAAPDVTTMSTPELAQTLLGGLHAHGEVARAEARAQMAAMGTQLQAQLHADTTPPPGDQLDTRPLVQAIVGTWRNPIMTVSFAADGTGTQTMMNGRETSGQWSVDAQGQLHAQLMGQDQTAAAWIAGDTLTISIGTQALAFQRQT